MNIDELPIRALPTPEYDQRAFFCGATGSGKTVLMKEYLVARRNVHVLDTKLSNGYRDGGGVGIEVDGEEIYKNLGPGRFVWHTPDDFNIEYNSQSIERYFNEIYHIGNRGLGIDEILDLANASVCPFSVNRVYTRGRERGIGILAGAQSSIGIPTVVRTQSEHKYAFYVEDENDQARMDGIFSRPLPWAYLLKHEHSFFYRDPRGVVHGPFRLQITPPTGATP